MANVDVTTNPGVISCINESVYKKLVRKITYTDIVNGGTYADNDTATFTLPIAAGDIVEYVVVRLITAFNDSGGGDELNVEVGDGTDPDGFVTTAALHTDQTEISWVYNTGAYYVGEAGTTDPVNVTNGKLYTTADTLDILITPNVSTGTDYNLGELTAGEFEVYAFILPCADRA